MALDGAEERARPSLWALALSIRLRVAPARATLLFIISLTGSTYFNDYRAEKQKCLSINANARTNVAHANYFHF